MLICLYLVRHTWRPCKHNGHGCFSWRHVWRRTWNTPRTINRLIFLARFQITLSNCHKHSSTMLICLRVGTVGLAVLLNILFASFSVSSTVTRRSWRRGSKSRARSSTPTTTDRKSASTRARNWSAKFRWRHKLSNQQYMYCTIIVCEQIYVQKCFWLLFSSTFFCTFQEIHDAIQYYEQMLTSLSQRCDDVTPLRARSQPQTRERPITALCSYKQLNVRTSTRMRSVHFFLLGALHCIVHPP